MFSFGNKNINVQNFAFSSNLKQDVKMQGFVPDNYYVESIDSEQIIKSSFAEFNFKSNI